MNNPTPAPLASAPVAPVPGISYMASGHYVFSNEHVRSFCEADSDEDALKIAYALNAAPALREALQAIIMEWPRQKGLFPDLSRDGWMDKAVAEAATVLATLNPEAR